MERRVKIVPEAGLHARPASKFVKEAKNYDSDVTVTAVKNDMEADAESMLEVTSLGAEQGDEVVITAEGEDAEEALDALEEVLSTEEKEEEGDGDE
ncbi:MAG: HPr family phosphocarrier protein [Candidatus Nanohaloarchaea archaeon]|nr:HPr family phosphocarrier protein [Candidatus Nanohaloarchaea archaeon]